MRLKSTIMDDMAVKRALFRISHEIIERGKGVDNTVLIGIVTRGVPMARMLRDNIHRLEGKLIPIGELDITMYRDDLSRESVGDMARINATSIDFDITGKDVVLVDDVLYTGRTVRAAIDAIMQLGRPKTIQLAIMVDRGHRELPIRADYVGKNLPTSHDELVAVRFEDTDGEISVQLYDIK
ncbi:MAG: bifunctional pyr operon transcriptional regulator/uracil phosphoribosyltransferase PyrR [Clostridia bacterium]|nr:bifunctional pyr operon transcriptional regulator/uracil phosphoribosyltransferase PyrR [Clostridia bacterium]